MSFTLNYADFGARLLGPVHCKSAWSKYWKARAPRAPWSRRLCSCLACFNVRAAGG